MAQRNSLLEMIKISAAKIIKENASPIWSVYVIVNISRKEIYYGISKDPVRRIIESHAAHKTKTIAHWAFESDEHEEEVLHEGFDKYKASKVAHLYEKIPVKGYNVLQTAGN